MVNGIDNIYLVNAPAGSGKTTWIRRQVEKCLLENDDDNILCITYTNRAAEELGRGIDSNRVFFGTIHSFISKYIGSFFGHKKIIDLYWCIYKEKISQRINNVDQKKTVAESNSRYIEKYGALDLETVYSNLKKISYGETPYTSLYYGSLGHDDLISFTKKAVEKYPVILKKIRDKYQLVFIDEYQDTAADVLNIFYESMSYGTGKMYLLGDKMQQIYKTYDGSFEYKFKYLNKSKRLDVNFRTTPCIVSILNSIYNDVALQQYPCDANSNDQMVFVPKVIFTNDRGVTIDKFKKEYNDALILYLTNKERFYGIGVGNLYDVYNSMDKYGFTKKYNVSDVLTKEEVWHQDILLNAIFSLIDISNLYNVNKLGDIFKIAKNNKKVINRKTFSIKIHDDKKILHDKLEKLVSICKKKETTIDSFLKSCYWDRLIEEKCCLEIIEDENYNSAMTVSLSEIIILKEYLNNPYISTQHGVKGESHDTVLFVAENSSNPFVNMSKFFNTWSKIDIVLCEFDDFYYSFLKLIKTIENKCGMKISGISAGNYKQNESFILEKIGEFNTAYDANVYYKVLLKEKIIIFLTKKNKSTLQACLKENLVYGVLSAYRLFYVGCSRARRNLAIVIQNSDVEGFKEKLMKKFRSVGFAIEDVQDR